MKQGDGGRCTSRQNSPYRSWKMLLVPGLSELSDKLLRYAERTFARVFQFVYGLTEVKDIYDLTKLQTEFIEAQISAMTELVRDMSENTTKGNLKVPTSNAAQPTVTLKQIAGALAERHGMARKRMDELLKGTSNNDVFCVGSIVGAARR